MTLLWTVLLHYICTEDHNFQAQVTNQSLIKHFNKNTTYINEMQKKHKYLKILYLLTHLLYLKYFAYKFITYTYRFDHRERENEHGLLTFVK